MNITNSIKSIQDIMRKDAGLDGDAQRIGQLTWLLFLKVFDQREKVWEKEAKHAGKTYLSPIPEQCRWRSWAKYKTGRDAEKSYQIAPGELIQYVNDVVLPGLRELNIHEIDDEVSRAKARVVREVFVDTNNYMKSGTLMLKLIEKLDEAIHLNNFKTRKNLGDVYEHILNDLRSAGNAGEFYTPRAVTHFMAQMVNPRLCKGETVLDPACGTGGFLTAAIDHLNTQISQKSRAEDTSAVESSIHGIEKKHLPHLLCITNMMLHGIDVPSQIEHKNTLAKAWNDWSPDEQADCLITNPPFGGMEEEGVGADFPADLLTRDTTDMFITLIVKKLMKEGGRGAVVVPDGNLSGAKVTARVRKLLLSECNLHTIIRLPRGVFYPYTLIKTNILFFTKGEPTETIWYYEHPLPAGRKSYSKTKPIKFEEFLPEKEWWGSESDGFADRVENGFAWRVDFKAKRAEVEAKAKLHWDEAESLKNQAHDKMQRYIVGKKRKLQYDAVKLREKAKEEQAKGDKIYWPVYNLDINNPFVEETVTYDPEDLLESYNGEMEEIASLQNQLKDILGAALSPDEVL